MVSNTGPGASLVTVQFVGLSTPQIQLEPGPYSISTFPALGPDDGTPVAAPFENHADLNFRLEYVVPELGTLGLLALGSLVVVIRRR